MGVARFPHFCFCLGEHVKTWVWNPCPENGPLEGSARKTLLANFCAAVFWALISCPPFCTELAAFGSEKLGLSSSGGPCSVDECVWPQGPHHPHPS